MLLPLSTMRHLLLFLLIASVAACGDETASPEDAPQMHDGSELRVRFVEANGRPIAGVPLFTSHPDGSVKNETTTDSEGWAEFADWSEGDAFTVVDAARLGSSYRLRTWWGAKPGEIHTLIDRRRRDSDTRYAAIDIDNRLLDIYSDVYGWRVASAGSCAGSYYHYPPLPPDIRYVSIEQTGAPERCIDDGRARLLLRLESDEGEVAYVRQKVSIERDSETAELRGRTFVSAQDLRPAERFIYVDGQDLPSPLSDHPYSLWGQIKADGLSVSTAGPRDAPTTGRWELPAARRLRYDIGGWLSKDDNVEGSWNFELNDGTLSEDSQELRITIEGDQFPGRLRLADAVDWSAPVWKLELEQVPKGAGTTIIHGSMWGQIDDPSRPTSYYWSVYSPVREDGTYLLPELPASARSEWPHPDELTYYNLKARATHLPERSSYVSALHSDRNSDGDAFHSRVSRVVIER